LKESLVSDETFKRVIIAGVVLVVGTCLVSQAVMQMNFSGKRDLPVDFSDQLPGNNTDVAFPDGLPPFISSAGAYYPEKAIFNVGLALGGILVSLLGVEMFLRSRKSLTAIGATNWRHFANLVQAIAAIVMGFSLVMLTRYPFNTSVVIHIIYAMNIFYGSLIWMVANTVARAPLDSEVSWRGHSITRVRWLLFAAGIISFQLMTGLIATGNVAVSAIFEWTLTFSAEISMLTIIPAIGIISSAKSAEGEDE